MNSELLQLGLQVSIIPSNGGVQLRTGDEKIVAISTDNPELLVDAIEGLRRPFYESELILQPGINKGEFHELVSSLRSSGFILPVITPHAEGLTPLLIAPGIAISGDGEAVEIFSEIAHLHNLKIERIDQATGVLVSITEQPNISRHERINQLAIESGRSALFIDMSHGAHATIGPFYIPNDGACFACQRERLYQNSGALTEQQSYDQWQRTGGQARGTPIKPATRSIVYGLAVLEVLNFISQSQPIRTRSGAMIVSFADLTITHERIFRLPWCPECS